MSSRALLRATDPWNCRGPCVELAGIYGTGKQGKWFFPVARSGLPRKAAPGRSTARKCSMSRTIGTRPRPIKRWLESEGARVIGPASGLGSSRVLADVHRPHVAVVDLNLGGCFAYPLITSLYRRGVPVVVVTAYSFAHEVTANLGAGLAKPVEKDALVRAVEAALHAAATSPPPGKPPLQVLQ